MICRIALVGTNLYLRTDLTDILRATGFIVDLYGPDTIQSLFRDRLHEYTVVIAGDDLLTGLADESVIGSSLAARGFFVFDDQGQAWDREPPFLINADMSPELIIAKINDIMFMNTNTRKSPRIRLNQPVDYEYDGNRCQSTFQDISENGAFIITLAPPPNGTKITMRFSLPGGPDIVVMGRSIYTIGYNLTQRIISHPSSCDKKIIALPGVGVMFCRISDADRMAIRDFIKSIL